MNSTTPKKRGWKYWLRLLLVGLIGGPVIGYAVFIVLYIEGTTHPPRSSVCCITPADAGFDYERVTFTSSDGIKLSGWYIPSQNKVAVILLHGGGGNRAEMVERAGFLARQGYGVLLYDLRVHGESGGDVGTPGWLDVKDVVAALEWLQRRRDLDPERIGILGFSLGGQIAIRAAAQTGRIKAVVTDGASLTRIEDAPPPASVWERVSDSIAWIVEWGIERRTGVSVPPGVVQVIANISPRPILLIATGQDIDELRISRHYYEKAGQPKALWEIPEAQHGGGPKSRPDEYANKIVTFFNQALLSK